MKFLATPLLTRPSYHVRTGCEIDQRISPNFSARITACELATVKPHRRRSPADWVGEQSLVVVLPRPCAWRRVPTARRGEAKAAAAVPLCAGD